jgi:hypothetical protein
MPRVGGGLDASADSEDAPIGGPASCNLIVNGNAELPLAPPMERQLPRRECLDHVIVFGATRFPARTLKLAADRVPDDSPSIDFSVRELEHRDRGGSPDRVGLTA